MSPKRAEKLFWWLGWVYDFSKLATVLLLLGLITHYFFFTVLIVRGRSMEPNYQDGQVLIINKLRYRLARPDRGEVVAMFFPGETERRFIKRVVGLPGERVTVKEGQLLINGAVLEEPYLAEGLVTVPELERELQTNEYFVLGDNRTLSSDSRAWGAVPRSFIIGRIDSKLFPQPLATAAN